MSTALALALDQITPSLQLPYSDGTVTDQIEGLITVYKGGHVERPPIVACIEVSSLGGVVSQDMVIDKYSNLWVRVYVPVGGPTKLPLVVYYHGGGFCVGSAAWSCYHHFLSKLCLKAQVVIMSVNYRLAPENPLPAAYDDGFLTLRWIKQTKKRNTSTLWTKRCDFSRVFLAGDSAGANIAHYLASKLGNTALKPLELKGTSLIQPFMGGQARTKSERSMGEAPPTVLSLEAADTYWRLALPAGADREHRWCKMEALKLPPELIFTSSYLPTTSSILL